jgi:hypothetical protein
MTTKVPIPMYMQPPSPSFLFPAISVAKRERVMTDCEGA